MEIRLGENIRTLRKAAGLTQEALAEALGVTTGAVYKWESGRAMPELELLVEIAQWMLSPGRGLRSGDTVNWMDRGDVRLCTILAEAEQLRGNHREASAYLAKAWEAARRFDAAPEYRTGTGMKFFHGSSGMTSYDDMGQTAMDMIENALAAEENGEGLRPLWEKVKKELSASRVSSTDGCLPGGTQPLEWMA